MTRNNMEKQLILILGGARSGQSACAESLARQGEPDDSLARRQSVPDGRRIGAGAEVFRRPAILRIDTISGLAGPHMSQRKESAPPA